VRIDQLGLICASLVIGGASPNFTLSVGTPGAPLLGLGGPGGGTFGPINCLPNQVAVGHLGNTSDYVEAYGLVCSAPRLIVQ
jgi:hypothetical protein